MVPIWRMSQSLRFCMSKSSDIGTRAKNARRIFRATVKSGWKGAATNYEGQYIQKLTTNYGPLWPPIVHHQLSRAIQFFAARSYDLMYVTLVAVSRAFSRICRRGPFCDAGIARIAQMTNAISVVECAAVSVFKTVWGGPVSQGLLYRFFECHRLSNCYNRSELLPVLWPIISGCMLCDNAPALCRPTDRKLTSNPTRCCCAEPLRNRCWPLFFLSNTVEGNSLTFFVRFRYVYLLIT